MGSRALQSTIEIAGVLSPSLQAAINGAISELEEMSQETLDAAGAAAKLCAEIGTQESVLKNLQKGYANYVVSGQESSDEAQALANKIQELSSELEENKGVLKAAEAAADQLANAQDDLGDAAEDAGQKAENSSEGYTVLKNVIANLATEAIEMAVEGFKELAIEGDNALAKLEARTGATGEKMEGFEDVMYEVYNANYGDSIGDVSDALSTVIQMTDNLDNASLAKVTKNAIALDDVFGFDVTESMRAANSLMDKFGITSDQAFNLIVQGAQKGLNQNDDLLDTINEYSVQFADAGYSADDMFNMLANGAESGTWSVDKLGDAVKEFNIRMSDGTANDYLEQLGVDVDSVITKFNKGGPEAQAAIGTVMNAIMACDDATLQYQAGVGIFGTMWEDLGADTVASLMNTQGAINSTNEAMKQMDTAAYDTLEASVSQLGRTIKAEVLQPIASGLTPALKGVVDFANNNLPTLGVVITGVAAAMTAFKVASISAKLATEGFTIATKAQAIAQGLLNTVMNANPIGLLILGITALVAVFVTLWNNCEGFRNFWINLWANIQAAAGAAVEWLKSCWASLSSFLSETWETIKNVVQVGIMAIGSILSAAFQIITMPFRFIWENCKETVTAAWTAITSTIGSKLTAAKEKVTAVTGAIKSVASSAWSAVSSAASAKWESIRSTIGSKLSSAKATVSSTLSGIASTMSEKLGAAFNTVSSKFSSIYSTIQSKMQAAKDAVGSAISALKEKMNFSWSLPKLKLPHVNISGKFSLDPPSVPKFSIDWYKDGGILTKPTIFGAAGNRLLAGGEAGAEAVLPLAVLWDKLETMIRSVFDSASTTGGTSDAGLTSKAGELLTLDNFSLGSLADGTNVVIYYDFSNFTWSPQIQTGGTGDNEDDLMARLRAHEAEFFDWLEEFIQMREVAQYA